MRSKPRWLKWSDIAFLVLLFGMITARLTFYQPLGLSISMHDTESFIGAAQGDLFSYDFISSPRPAAIGVFYKLLEPAAGYQPTIFSSPAEQIENSLGYQPGLNRVTTGQAYLSIFAWSLLALVVYRNLSNKAIKLLGAFLVLVFGFSPALSEWDYVLLSEPISLALFVVVLALFIEMVPRILREGSELSTVSRILVFGWLVAAILWVFARDTNAYAILIIDLALVILLVFTRQWRLDLPVRFLVGVALMLGLVFVIQSKSLQDSGRWVNPFFNNMLTHVFPQPEFVDYFRDQGMPITDEVWALRTSTLNEKAFFEIQPLLQWVEAKGSSTYIRFLLFHPTWTIKTFLQQFGAAFSENVQPFFTTNHSVTPESLFFLNDLFHPRSATVFWAVLVQLTVFILLAVKLGHRSNLGIALTFVLFFGAELVMLFIIIHGDASSLVRHAMGSIMPLRLSVWLLPPFVLDEIASCFGLVKA